MTKKKSGKILFQSTWNVSASSFASPTTGQPSMWSSDKKMNFLFPNFYLCTVKLFTILKAIFLVIKQPVLCHFQDSNITCFAYEHAAPTFNFLCQLCERRREKEGFIFLNRQFLMHASFTGSCNTIC